MASRGLNKVMLIGNFGADPELRSLPNGGNVANFSIATTESWVDKQTNKRNEETEWHRVTFFGRMAEILGEYGTKGGKVYIEGSLRTRKWTDKEGKERYATEIRGRDFTFLSSNQNSSSNSTQQSDQSNFDDQSSSSNFDDMGDDNIPF